MKIAILCFLGAFLGTLMALQFQPSFWSVLSGMTVGGLVGYLTYEPKEVWAAVKGEILRTAKVPWKIIIQLTALMCLLWVMLTAVAVVSVLALINTLDIWSLMWRIPQSKNYNFLNHFPWLFYLGGTMVSGWFTCDLYLSKGGDMEDKVSLLGNNKYWFLPLLLAPAICPLVPLAIAFAALYYTAKFLIQVFRLIHSDMRLLCMTDAAIGAAIGSYYGNPLIGGVSGAILGVLNYELVSVRWLKLVPAK